MGTKSLRNFGIACGVILAMFGFLGSLLRIGWPMRKEASVAYDPSPLYEQSQVEVDAKGRIYVAGTDSAVVAVFSPEGEFQYEYRFPPFNKPNNVSFHIDDDGVVSVPSHYGFLYSFQEEQTLETKELPKDEAYELWDSYDDSKSGHIFQDASGNRYTRFPYFLKIEQADGDARWVVLFGGIWPFSFFIFWLLFVLGVCVTVHFSCTWKVMVKSVKEFRESLSQIFS